MRVTRIYTGDDGQSHFEEIEVPMEEPEVGRRRSRAFPGRGFSFREVVSEEKVGFHPAPQRQLVVVTAGTLEIECGDGTKRSLRPGEIMLADDTTGQGHRSRSSGGVRRSVVIALGADFDLGALRG